MRIDQNIELPAVPASRPSGRAALPVLRTVLAAIAAAILLVTFARLVSLGQVFKRLEHLDVPLALGCGVVFLAAYCIRAVRWRLFLAPTAVRLPRVIAIYQAAIFINWLLPIRGGELVKGLLLRRLHGLPLSRSLPTVAMDKVMDLLPAFVLILLLPFLHLHLSRPLWAILLFVLLLLALGALLLLLVAWRRPTAVHLIATTTRWLPGRLRTQSAAFAIGFLDTLLALARRPRLLALAALITAVAVLCDALFCWLAFAAVGVSPPFGLVLFGYTFYNLAYILPTPPGQIGSNEVLGLLVFSGLLHMNQTGVAAMFLFSHPWTALLMTGTGLACLSAMGLTLRGTLSLRASE
jgi:uncharacterized protein (TIRG00374 family)